MALDVDIQSVAGTKIGISASAPLTFDVAGYAALNYANIGEITDAGSHGRKYNVIKHNPIDTRGTKKLKGSFDEGTKTLKLAISPNDPGQKVLRDAVKSDAPFSFCVTYQDNSKDYFQALATSFEKAASGVDDILNATVELELTTSKDGTGIVEELAPSNSEPIIVPSLPVPSEQSEEETY